MTGARSVLADEVTTRVLAAGKYRGLDQGIVRRIAAEAAERFSDRTLAVKYAKRKLHQAFGAFRHGSAARAVHTVVAEVGSGRADLTAAAADAMRAHASSAERIEWLTPLYRQVAEWCGTPSSVADLACGLNPLAIPWMRLAPGAAYWACEIDADLVAALAGLNEIMPARLTGQACDLVAAPPPVRADVGLLLKTVTTIEQQRPGAAAGVLAALDCRHVIVSLPRRSLSGRLGYADGADAIVRTAAAGSRYRVGSQAAFGDELVYHLGRD
jgi:16S rRNA (guanine(1405)-N(7))-methyltransferase